MRRGKISRILVIPLVLALTVALVATAACTPEELEVLNGVLQKVDSADGKITIVTKDGKTVTIKIDTKTEVAAGGATANATNLAPGANVEVRVKKDGQVASQIKARQSQVEGIITKIESGNVTIQARKGNPVTVVTTNTTRIEQGDEHAGTLADLKVGQRVHAKYDPTTYQAFKIEIQGKEKDDENENRGKGKAGEEREKEPNERQENPGRGKKP